MAFPSVAATSQGSQNSSTETSQVLNLPSGIASGNLLVMFLTSDGNPSMSWPAGWTSVYGLSRGTAVRQECRYRIADGTEGSTITVTTSVGEKTTHVCYRVTDWHGTAAPDGAAASGNDNSPNPPNLTPSWGAADTLWFAAEGNDTQDTISSVPTNYTNEVTEQGSGGSTGAGTSTARRVLNAASENPGVFTKGTADDWVAATVAIRPADPAPTLPHLDEGHLAGGLQHLRGGLG